MGKIGDRTYAFLGLERAGGIVIFDVTIPSASTFVGYADNSSPNGDLEAGAGGDAGPEGLEFVSPAASPRGEPLLLAANDISGTTTVYQIAAQ